MTQWTPSEVPPLQGKTAIVTGANSGLGLVTARELARKGAQVVMACRNISKAENAAADIREHIPTADLEVRGLDLADLESIENFASTFADEHEKLDILCNNAGVMALPLRRTTQGFEMQIGTNHLGHFALTGHLLNTLEAADHARVVNTASMAHRWTRGMDFGDMNWEHKRYRKWDAYGKSKLANLLFTFEMQRRLATQNCSTIAVAAHPGYSATHLQTAGPEMEGSALGQALMSISNALLGQSADQGAEPILYAAAMTGVRGGEYYGPDGFRELRGHPKRVRANRAANNQQAAKDLWALSETLTGVKYLS